MKHLLIFTFLMGIISCRTTVTIDYPTLIEDISEDSLIVIRNVDLYPGSGSSLVRHQDVYIRGEYIEKIQATGDSIPAGATLIEGSTKTLLPGFIDSHVHILSGGSAPWAKIGPSPIHNLHAWLYAGITTVYDLGGVAEATRPIQEGVANNNIFGPDIFFTGAPVTVKNSHPIPALKELNPWPASSFITRNIYTIRDANDAAHIISDLAKLEVDYIKLICDELPPGSPAMSESLLKPLVTEAHKKGFKVFVHIGSTENALDAARAGADVLTHTIYRDKLNAEEAKQLKDAGVKMIFTISGFENINQIYQNSYQPTPMDTVLSPGPVIDPVTGERASAIKKAPVMFGLAKAIHANVDHYSHNFSLFQQNDIPFYIGTDSPNYGAYPGSSFHQEMEALVRYGYSESQVLEAATGGGASLFLENPNFGFVREGFVANLVLLNDNPLEEIKSTSKIHTVIKRGKVVKRSLE